MNNLKKNLFCISIIFFVSATSAFAQVTMNGGKGLLRLYDAEPVYPGHFYINPFYLGYFTTSSEDNIDEGDDVTDKGLEDHTLNIGLTLGLSKKFEFLTQLVPYQDDQSHVWGPIGDTKIGLKYHKPGENNVLQFGLLGLVTLPTAPEHNVKFEPFSTDQPGWALMGLINFDLKNAASSLPLKFSLNIGYKDNDWYDRFFIDKKDQLIGGAGLKFPIRSSVLYSELYTEFFVNNTEIVPTSYNFTRFTQGLRFVGPANLIFDIAADIRIGNKPSEEEIANSPFIKDFSDWKIILGATYRTTLFHYLTPEEKLERQRQIEEANKLKAIRKEREKVAKELKEMREKLEKEKKENSEKD